MIIQSKHVWGRIPGKNTAAMRQNLPSSTLEEVGYENKSIHNSPNVCIACVCGYECMYVHDNFRRLRSHHSPTEMNGPACAHVCIKYPFQRIVRRCTSRPHRGYVCEAIKLRKRFRILSSPLSSPLIATVALNRSILGLLSNA